MATKQEFQARLRSAVRETVQKVLAEGNLPERAEGAALFTILEDLALDAGDAVSLELFEQQLAELAADEQPPDCCPQCGRVGKQVKRREREITTRRGLAVPLPERECYCPGCRRAFFPQRQQLGLDVDYDVSPAAIRKIVRAGTKQASFAAGSEELRETGEIPISSERVRRRTERIGRERVAQRAAHAEAFATLPLPEQRKPLRGQVVPEVVCVQMDGGRLQIRDRQSPERNDHHTFWREFKAGCLWTMKSKVSPEDPCPELPPQFVDPQRMQRLVREIKGFSGPAVPAQETSEDADESPIDERPQRPELIARSVVATCSPAETFGSLLAAEAYYRNFFVALRKAFVCDGSATNWGIHAQWFSDFVPILDFIHGLTYAYAAAFAGISPERGWQTYVEWAQRLWSGEVDRVITALEQRLHSLGGLPEDAPDTAPAAVVAKSLGYYRNQRTRMDYPAYRQQGLPITSAHIESTVKQLNRRIKGTEKFWSEGAEALTTLAGDYLSV